MEYSILIDCTKFTSKRYISKYKDNKFQTGEVYDVNNALKLSLKLSRFVITLVKKDTNEVCPSCFCKIIPRS